MWVGSNSSTLNLSSMISRRLAATCHTDTDTDTQAQGETQTQGE
eukprot:COSAG03_NODE_1856_length_3426_cov_89.148783_4_plen_44_part_00